MTTISKEESLKLYASCRQCPRKCSVDRTAGKTGFCQEENTIRIASAGLHFGEEPPITAHGGSGTIFFTGCTLRCSFCQNYQISQNGMGREVSKADFIKICLSLEKMGAENINLVTGSHHIPLLALWLRELKEAGLSIPIAWNSSAYESVEMLSLLRDCVDIWLPDFKTQDKALSKDLFGAEDYPSVAQKAIAFMLKTPLCIKKEKMQSGTIVRHLFLPGNFEDTVNTLTWLKENADGKALISLMSQYTPVPFFAGKKKGTLENRLVSEQEDQDLRDLIEAFDFSALFYQELSSDTDWLPDFSKPHPFKSSLAKPLWHWKEGFLS